MSDWGSKLCNLDGKTYRHHFPTFITMRSSPHVVEVKTESQPSGHPTEAAFRTAAAHHGRSPRPRGRGRCFAARRWSGGNRTTACRAPQALCVRSHCCSGFVQPSIGSLQAPMVAEDCRISRKTLEASSRTALPIRGSEARAALAEGVRPATAGAFLVGCSPVQPRVEQFFRRDQSIALVLPGAVGLFHG